jgi:hypothetical protein
VKTANVTLPLGKPASRRSAPRFVAPAWVAQIAVSEKAAAQTFAALGANVLVDSALLCGGIRQVSRAGNDRSPSPRGLNKILRGLPERFQATEPPLPQRFAQLIEERIAKKVVQANVLPVGRALVADEICSLLQSVVDAAKSPPEEPARAGAALSPLRVITAVGAVLRARRSEVDASAADARCVVAAGVAYRGLLRMRRCRWCFRWAWAGQQSCAWHSLSMEVGGTRSQRQAGYEAGKRVSELIGQAAYSQSSRYHRMSEREADWVVARALFATPLVQEEAVCERLIAALRRSVALPAAAMREGVDLLALNRRDVVDGVRSWLDPAELRPVILLQEVAAAERWYRAAERALPGRRGRGREMKHVRRRALAACALPGATRATVAKSIGRHPSAISHWFGRDGHHADIRRLRAALEKRRSNGL